MKRLRHFLSSMVGRLFVILLLGMAVAAIGATMLATSKRQQEFERQNLNRIADRLQGYVNLLDGNPELRERLLAIGGPSVRALQPGARLGRADTALMEVLEDRPGPVSRTCALHFIPLLHSQAAGPAAATAAGPSAAAARTRPGLHPAQVPRGGRDPQRRHAAEAGAGLAGSGAQRHPGRGPVVPDPAGAGDRGAGLHRCAHGQRATAGTGRRRRRPRR